MEQAALPDFELLYSLDCDLGERVDYGIGPKGRRIAIPIIGGTFEGPKMKGVILNQGADWGLVDSKTGVFHADTRYTLKTADETPAYLFLQTKGPLRPDSVGGPPGLQLHITIETGDERYYWLNDTSIIGITRMYNDTRLRIDAYAFNMKTSSA